MRVNQKIPPPKKILHSKSSKHKNGKLFLCFDHTGQLKYQVRTQNSVVMANLSKKSLMIRKKWQQEAVKRGGKDAKIIYSSTEALPVIFALLRDVFAPLNITSIYEVSIVYSFLCFYQPWILKSLISPFYALKMKHNFRCSKL
jgi:hypothetical protein